MHENTFFNDGLGSNEALSLPSAASPQKKNTEERLIALNVDMGL